MHKLILASKSPYKKELLMRLGIHFDTVDADIDEAKYKENLNNIQEVAEKLAIEKALAVQRQFQDAVIIGADQICFFEGRILSKTNNVNKSFEQLMKMQGKEHELYTSYAIVKENSSIVKTILTKLQMRNLNEKQIKNYLREDNPIDCAGSYKLELKGVSLFRIIETSDQTAIVGLPLISLGNDLNKMGFSVPPER